MALETAYIQEKLSQKFGNHVLNFEMQRDVFSFEATSETVHEVIQFLKENQDLNFHFLTDLCGVHFPDNDDDHQFEVVYHTDVHAVHSHFGNGLDDGGGSLHVSTLGWTDTIR